MAEKHLIESICRHFEALPASERTVKIRKLAGKSLEDRMFIRSAFPKFYREACSLSRVSSGVGAESG